MSALILSSCGTKKAEQKKGTHVHADGTVHEAHDHEAPAQESFDVKEEHACKGCDKDSCATKEECDDHKKESAEHDHSHDHGHDHDHDHN
ncbi:hypothetical protein [Carboxylicivirga marina]